jgi:MFS family permease
VDQQANSGTFDRKAAMRFIILFGIISLFADITYEGGRSVTGPFMAILGASGAVVGLVSGLGEFLGYGLRLASGYLSDKTQKYWFFTFLGYGLILAIPFLAFAGNFQLAALFIILERMGKAIRSPARDTILSHVTKKVGRGWGFGIHEALDQIGAITGPLILMLVLYLRGSYRSGFLLLFLPTILVLLFLIIAMKTLPTTRSLEEPDSAAADNNGISQKLPASFYFYSIFIFFAVLGFANFQIISYHFKVKSVITDAQIPMFYAIAMAVDAVTALIIGKLYDKVGMKTLIMIPVFTLLIPLFAFSRDISSLVIAVALWGAVMGAHETIMRASIADMVPTKKRGTAYGIFNTIYGLAWFLGSLFLGKMYDVNVSLVILFVVLFEILSLPFFFAMQKKPSGFQTA